MHIDRCGLCLKSSELKASHCLPAALYRLSREPGRKDPNPVVIRPTTTITSSKQVSAPFLCKFCEQRFSSGGESLVLAECARSRTQFKLRQRITTLSPLEKSDDPSFAVYDAHAALGGALDNYLYFATSVYWRASAHKWTWGGETVRGISLGDTYEEQFRRYLLGEESLPSNARIFLHVSSEAEVGTTTVFPCTSRVNGTHRHKFYIPGLLFTLFLGRNVLQDFERGSLNSTGQKGVWLCPFEGDSLFRGMQKVMRGSRPLGNLRR
jgi:hypothetical protein